jgi:CheY-like chemotaxis protein
VNSGAGGIPLLSRSIMPRILIVDDAPAIRRVFNRTLTQSGLDVVEADNGRLALELALKHRPDAIVADIEIPEMDGVELVRQVRANEATKSAKILIVSGNLMQRGFAALEAGCDAVLEKPCPPHLLVNTVKWLLGTSKES